MSKVIILKNSIKLMPILIFANVLVGCCIGNCKEDPNAKNNLSSHNSETGDTISTPSNMDNNQSQNHCPDDLTQKAMLEAVNTVRSEGRYCGSNFYPAVEPLVWDGHLAQSASLHAKDMADNDYYSHDSQDGRKFYERIIQAGYPSNTAKAENIAVNYRTLDEAINGWIKSPKHCENIMSPDYQDFGMACASNAKSKYSTYWVQNFGKK